jgi:predicted RNA binding protein YcfA (HicA-like mRNA interferase family)
MPRKVRELKGMLKAAGFVFRPGKGSHTIWTHPLYPGRLTVSGSDGDDARLYLEKDVKQAIELVTKAQEEEDI